MLELEGLLKTAIIAAIDAGKATLQYYNTKLDVEKKSDDSPLTIADLKSNAIIEKQLKETNIPVLSEEGNYLSYAERKKWELLWIVDPLDGTKEFIKKSDQYTVNIALVKKNTPILGVVYAPAIDLLYYGIVGVGAYKIDGVSSVNLTAHVLDNSSCIKLPEYSTYNDLTIVASRSHLNPETDKFIKKIGEIFGKTDILSIGSSLKLCMIAEGSAQIYPRLAPTMEWDTAASHAIVLASGAGIAIYPSFKDLTYNKENLLNPWFIVYSKDLYKSLIKM